MAVTPTDADTGILPRRAFPGEAGLAELTLPPNADNARIHEMLEAGFLALQRCRECRRCRTPFAPVCPFCRLGEFDWVASSGKGRIVSWVRYHRSYLPAFERLVPYVVVCVELEEGPRRFGRLADAAAEPRAGMAVFATIEKWDDGGLAPAFVPEPEGG